MRDLTANLGVPLAGRDVLLLGAGGAARGMLLPLLRAATARSVTSANRTTAKAEALAAQFAERGADRRGDARRAGRARFRCRDQRDQRRPGRRHDALWPEGLFRPGAFAYDMIYADAPTPFLRWAQGARRARAPPTVSAC